MRKSVVKLMALALALATTATVAFAQRPPRDCIPQYDTSGAQTAPYCAW